MRVCTRITKLTSKPKPTLAKCPSYSQLFFAGDIAHFNYFVNLFPPWFSNVLYICCVTYVFRFACRSSRFKLCFPFSVIYFVSRMEGQLLGAGFGTPFIVSQESAAASKVTLTSLNSSLASNNSKSTNASVCNVSEISSVVVD